MWVITIYCLRFKIETSFDEQKNDIGNFSYRFWITALPKRKRWTKNEYLPESALHKRVEEAKQRKLKKLARKTRDIRMKDRYDTVRLWLSGRSITEISEILNILYHTARNYIVAYIDSGIEGLAIKTPPGRKTKLTEEQEKAFYECIVNKMPKDVSFEPFVNWTAPLGCLWVKMEFGVSFSERSMRDVFYRLGSIFSNPACFWQNIKMNTRKKDITRPIFKNIQICNVKHKVNILQDIICCILTSMRYTYA